MTTHVLHTFITTLLSSTPEVHLDKVTVEQDTVHETASTDLMAGTACEADERNQHAGEKSTPHPHPADPPRRRANRRKGHGTSANERPAIIRVVSRDTGAHRFWVREHVHTRTCYDLIATTTVRC
jgi:hypothetical protein